MSSVTVSVMPEDCFTLIFPVNLNPSPFKVKVKGVSRRPAPRSVLPAEFVRNHP